MGFDHADHCLRATVHMDMLDPDLLSSGPIALECLHLEREGAGQLIKCPFRTVQLPEIFYAL
jgi:hypothetical protein